MMVGGSPFAEVWSVILKNQLLTFYSLWVGNIFSLLVSAAANQNKSGGINEQASMANNKKP